MDPELWKRAEALFHAALERPPEAREEFVHRISGGDETIEREVLSLLASRRQAEGFLEQPAIEIAARTVTHLDFAGHTVSHYRILEMLGAGGMGVVYKALDTRLNRPVALKFLAVHIRNNDEMKRLLKYEARAASALDHPNIVVIHDVDETPAGDLFIAMAFHEGGTLHERMRRDNADPLPLPDALRLARQIASGLARAHERGLFHRDIKPGNIIVSGDGTARIIDFGLAKSREAAATLDGASKGTPLYMSPEQVSAGAVDYRTDLWSLGAVLYEMLTGSPPFPGDSQFRIMHAIVHQAPAPLRDARPDLPETVALIVSRALEKDPAKRYQSAAEMERDLSAALTEVEHPAHPGVPSHRAWIVAAAAVLLLVTLAAGWLYSRASHRAWVREQAIPEITKLSLANRPVAAYILLRRALTYLPADPQLAQLTATLTHIASIRSSPSGADVEIKDYLSPGDAWLSLGATPLNNVRLPTGYLRWRVAKPGSGNYEGAPITADIHGPLTDFSFDLPPLVEPWPGMSPVPGNTFDEAIWSLGELGPFDLPPYLIDRLEVTNRRYQEFMDRGGYSMQQFWKEKFLRDGHELTWEQAMPLFRDATGRPGPSTWEGGRYPSGKADEPVGGVSWYEASAYAEYTGKSLPVIAQWFRAAPSPIARYVTLQSNFSPAGLAPVGKYQGLGPWGTKDMAGNIAEWCSTGAGYESRYILGGAWNTSSSEYWQPSVLPPFDRSPNSGFRCVKNSRPLPAAAKAAVPAPRQDFAKEKPVSDDVFRAYKAMYAFDRSPLNAQLESVPPDSPNWRKEKVTFNAAYGQERVTAYLFLPAGVKPPYQTVLFFPGSGARDVPSSKSLVQMNFIDYVIKSGRVVMYPVYKGTYERVGPDNFATTASGREALIQQSKDVGRSLDYLESRPDIDATKIAYMGESVGGALGLIFTTVEERFHAAILLDGGFYGEKMLPGANQVDFAPRLKKPTLFISGKYDWVFLGKDAMFQMLGTPAAQKRSVTFDTAHDVSEQRSDLIREVLGWLDQHLGRVS